MRYAIASRSLKPNMADTVFVSLSGTRITADDVISSLGTNGGPSSSRLHAANRQSHPTTTAYTRACLTYPSPLEPAFTGYQVPDRTNIPDPVSRLRGPRRVNCRGA